MTQTILFDPFDPQYNADPHAFYARLRQTASVQRATLRDGQTVWLVTGYAEVVAAFDDPRLVKDPRNARWSEELARLPALPEPTRYIRSHLLYRDPPDHTRLRRLVSKAFTPRMVEQLRPRVQAIADALLDAVTARGEMDVIDDYAFPLPITVIAEMLGIPAADRAQFRDWSDALLTGTPPQLPGPAAVAAAEGLRCYFEALFEERQRAPADDLITGLLQAEEAGDKLSRQELHGMVYLLLVAGYETTANLIGSGTLALLLHPDQLARLLRDPALLPSAVEELLRFCAPVATSTMRYAAEEVTLGGQNHPKGGHGARGRHGGQPRPGPVPIPRHARHHPRRQQAPRIRARPPLLFGGAAGPARGRNRSGDAVAPHAWTSAEWSART